MPVSTPPTLEEGLEVLITPDGNPATQPDASTYTTYPGGVDWSEEPYKWADITIGYPATVINGHTISVRYFTESMVTIPGEEDPEQPGENPPVMLPDEYELTRQYPTFYVVHAELIPLAPHNQLNPFRTENDPVTEFFVPPIPSTYSGGSYAVSGITDGTEYSYPKVFDQTEGTWINDMEPWNAPPVVSRFIPEVADQPPYEYPLDTLIQFVPDRREMVTVSYQLTIGYNLTSEEDPATETEVFTITQDVYQDMTIWPAIVSAMAVNTYLANGRRPMKPVAE